MKLNAEKARELLTVKRWTMKTLAAEANINYHNMTQYFGGTMSIGEQRLKRIADALGVDMSELILEEDPEPQTKEVQVFCPHCGKLLTVEIGVKK